MLGRTLKNLFQVTSKNCFAFSTHSEAPPTKLPKVQDITIKIFVKNKYGVVETVQAFVGQSLYEAIHRMKVHSYNHADLCNGYDYVYRPHFRPHDNDTRGPICGSCRVVFEDNWFNRLQQQTDGYSFKEEQLLHASLDLKENTRLACCIPVESWMNGLTCSVDIDPAEGEEAILM